MPTQTFAVQGMTCDHCVHAVSRAVTALGGVTSVQVDLGSGAVTVASTDGVDAAAVADAVAEAGYELAPG